MTMSASSKISVNVCTCLDFDGVLDRAERTKCQVLIPSPPPVNVYVVTLMVFAGVVFLTIYPDSLAGATRKVAPIACVQLKY